jgi:LSD1 subclass zinc finger protein
MSTEVKSRVKCPSCGEMLFVKPGVPFLKCKLCKAQFDFEVSLGGLPQDKQPEPMPEIENVAFLNEDV